MFKSPDSETLGKGLELCDCHIPGVVTHLGVRTSLPAAPLLSETDLVGVSWHPSYTTKSRGFREGEKSGGHMAEVVFVSRGVLQKHGTPRRQLMFN